MFLPSQHLVSPNFGELFEIYSPNCSREVGRFWIGGMKAPLSQYSYSMIGVIQLFGTMWREPKVARGVWCVRKLILWGGEYAHSYLTPRFLVDSTPKLALK